MNKTYETEEFVAMRDAYNFEKKRFIKADMSATMFSERLVSVMEKLGVINSEDITSDDQFLCAVDGWLDTPLQNQSALELLKEAECPHSEDDYKSVRRNGGWYCYAGTKIEGTGKGFRIERGPAEGGDK